MTPADLERELAERIAALLGLSAADVDLDAYLDELGLSSRDAVVLAGELEQLLGRAVAPTIAWEAPTIRLLAAHLLPADAPADPPADPPAGTAAAGGGPAGDPGSDDDRIAIVGLGCRLPGDVHGPEAFWDLLRGARDVVGEVPSDRWERAGGAPAVDVARHGAFLADVSGFDAEWFGISPREAALMDPQQRLLLETSVDALRHARLDPVALRGSRTGVYVGISGAEYGALTSSSAADVEFWNATGGALSMAANRVSYALDLRGPSLSIDSACSSSLVAVHSAVAALRSGECSLAIAGGVNLLLTPLVTAAFERGGVLAADGRCKSFGAGADGIGRAEGCGTIVLERLGDARAQGHRVLAVVAGSAVNSDGRSNGLTAPNPAAQEDVLRRAYAAAGLDPADVDYVEAHGTGTPLGDPVEAGALGRVLGAGRPEDRPLLLGSVKSNLGHLEAAAGVVSVIKVVLALTHDRLPATLHADTPNPHLDLRRDHLALVTADRPWPRYGGVARAGVSGFGFGGTNAHVVLEQAPAGPEPVIASSGGVAGQHVLAVTGRTPQRAVATARQLASWLDSGGGRDLPLADVARSLARAADEGAHRIAVAAQDAAGAALALRRAEPVAARSAPTGPVFVFAGYGQQWDAMARDLHATEPAFALAVDEACAALARHGCEGIGTLLRDGRPPSDMIETMAALFAIQVGLAAWWRSVGVVPAAVLGQSLGEVAAAVVAGALTLDDGARVMAVRSRLLAGIDAQDAGAMAMLDIAPDAVTRGAGDWPDVRVAVLAAPSQCTVAGPAAQVQRLVEHVEAAGRDAWPLRVATAGHTPAVDPVLPPLRAELEDLRTATPTTRWYGTVLGDPRDQPAFDADYWAANVRCPVRLADAFAAALADGHDTFVEISAHPVASPALRRTVTDLHAVGRLDDERAGRVTVLASMRRDDPGATARAVAGLHAAGHPGVLRAVEPDGPLVDLPPVPWQHRDHWFRAAPARPVTPEEPTLPPGALLAEGTVQVWTSDLVELPGHRAELTLEAAAALARAAARATGVDGTLAAVGLEPAARGGAALLSCTCTADGAEVEMLHRADGPAGSSWVRSMHARITLPADVPGATRPGGTAVVPATTATVPVTAAAVPVTAAPAPAPAAVTPSAGTSVIDTLRTILAQVMGVDPADGDGAMDWLTDDVPLVDTGLDSLMAARARHAVEHRFGVALSTRQLVQGMTLRSLAEHIQDARSGAATAAEQPVTPAPVPVASAEPEPERTVAPRDPTERLLAALWSRALGVATLSVTADLGAAGTAAAEQVRAALLARSGRSPDAATLLAAATVEAMADLVRADVEGGADDPVVRTLRAGDPGRRPLFVFHPAGGTCTVYRPLLEQLDPAVPVIGFDRLGDLDTVEERAAEYVEQLRLIAPHGPYRLLGWSFGGLLAGECAQRLHAAGEKVELLASIDTTLPRPDPTLDDTRLLTERYQRFAEHVERTYGARIAIPPGIAAADERTQLRLMQEAMLAGGVRLPAGVLRHQLTSYSDARVAERYRPSPWPHGMVLYRAQQVEELTSALDPRYHRTDAALGWDAFVPNLDLVSVPGDHITMIDRPNVDVLAADLTVRLAQLDGGNAAHHPSAGIGAVRSLPIGDNAWPR